ncbi:MAG: hypothetical protein HKL90_02310 [Elusimicrobia bacterium]|nr:hypothetical protein [Elusimicrobiota bacterium]
MINAQVRRCAAALTTFLCVAAAAHAQSAPPDPAYDRLYAVYQSSAVPYHIRYHLWRRLVTLEPSRRLPPPAPPTFSAPASSGPAAALALIGRRNGGQVLRADGAALRVPPGALLQDTPLTISSASYRDDPERRAQAAALTALGARPFSDAVAFGPDGLPFSAPATVVLPYARGGAGAPKIYAWDRARSAWTPLPTSVDPTARTVSAQVDSLAIFRVLAGAPHVSSSGFGAITRGGAHTAHAAWNVAVTPDPVTAAATFLVRGGALDGIDLRVYGGGRLVYKTTNFAASPSADGATTTYSAVWDASGTPDGVYDYVVTVRRAGQKIAVKTGRIRVAR